MQLVLSGVVVDVVKASSGPGPRRMELVIRAARTRARSVWLL